MKQAIVLCSGGLDSTVLAHYLAKKKNYAMTILFFDYGQKTLDQERACSRKCAKDLGAIYEELRLSELANLSTSLINRTGNSKDGTTLKNTREESKQWYVPCRNLIFLTYALALAEANAEKEGCELFVGFTAEGTDTYPDTTSEFVASMNHISKTTCKQFFPIKAPFIAKDKEDVVRLGERLGVDFKETISCYSAKKRHCGSCLACRLRKAGFYWAGVCDPTDYLMK